MNLFKKFIFLIGIVFLSSAVLADSHDKQNIVEKAKEINKKVKEKQALQQTSSKEEPLPLNDPFVGDGSLGGGSGVELIAGSEQEKRNLSVFNFKLVGIVAGENDMYASIIDENGDVITLAMYEELSPGVKLVGVNSREIVFERDEGSLVVINFKNQIIERNN